MTTESRLRRLRVARVAAAVVALAALVVLAVLAFNAETGRALVPGVPADGTATRPVPRPLTPPVVAPPPVRHVEVAAAAAPPSPAASAAAPAPVAPAPPAAAATAPAGAPVVVDDTPPVCPLALPPPERTGGLASLVGLVPAFGPFSAEAFAFAPAYEPFVRLFGPLLPLFAEQLARNQAAVAPLVEALRALEGAGFEAIGPLYEPYRPEVLSAMAALADQFAVYGEQLASSPLAGCLLAVEGALAAAAA